MHQHHTHGDSSETAVTMPDIDRRPAAVALKSMMLISSTPSALGLVPLPGSLQDTPGVYGQTAAVAICLGSLISIFGILWGWRRNHLDGLVIEQVGLVFIATGCILYGVALTGVEQPLEAMLAIGLCAGLVAFCATQYIGIRRFRRKRLDS
jgi:hypothetical protein